MAVRYPSDLPAKYHDYWARPWLDAAKNSYGFRRWLSKHELFTPHFSVAEMRCHDGTDVPWRLRHHTRDHLFRLEKFRHAVGDKSLPILSGFRTRSYNTKIGGASGSRHINADATDFSTETVNRVGRRKFFQVAEAIFANGGVGTYPSGSAHLDSRGYRARWSSW